jgi:cytoskeleton protein RodZ
MSEAVAGDGTSAGALLRAAREAAGLHVATLAANLKVPVRKLEALEEDRYDLLPDAVFVRALASSICRTLKIDPQPVLQRLPQTIQPRLAQDREGINAPFHAPRDGPGPGWLANVSKPVLITCVALLLAAAVLIFLPVAQRDEAPADATRTEQVMSPGGALPPGDTAQRVVPALAGSPAVPAAMPASASGAVPTAPAVTLAPGPSVAPAAKPAAPAAAEATPAAPADGPLVSGTPIAASGVVVFRTRGPSWVQVTDASGTTVLRRLMAAGETAGATGRLPLSVTVGDAAQTEVQVRGKPYDLGPVAPDNVARFEVK